MALLDIILLVCFVPAIVLGISKGFIKQLVDLVSIVLGAWAAFHFAEVVSNWLGNYLTWNHTVIYVISFAIIVIVAVLLLNLLGSLILRVVKIASLGWVNRLLGLVFGVLKTAFILGIIIMLFDSLNGQWNLVEPDKLSNCTVYGWLRDFTNAVFPYVKSFVTGGTAADAQ